MYKLVKDTLKNTVSGVLRLSDNAYIPFSPDNTDYANFKKEILADEAQLQDADGNVMADAKAYVASLLQGEIMGINAFTKTGNTVTFLANTTQPAPVQCLSSTLGGNQYRIINTSSNVTVFLGYGTTSAEANTNCAIVTSSQNALPILPTTDEILTFVPNAYFTGITASGNATIYITPGDGL